MNLFDVLLVFARWPVLALVPAGLLAWWYVRRRRYRMLCAAIAWVIYFLYEQIGMKMGYLCPAGPNLCYMRVDLIVYVYPLLAFFTASAIVSSLKDNDYLSSDRHGSETGDR